MAIYAFKGEFMTAFCKALGLEGRPIHKIRIEMEVNKPVTLYIEEYANFPTGEPYLLANILELATWTEPKPAPDLSNNNLTTGEPNKW